MKKSYVAAVLFACFAFAVSCALAQSYRNGDYASEVSIIQEALEELDLYYADITGHFGNKTERAVKLFQRKYGLPQTGVADEITLSRLYEEADIDDAPVVSESIGPAYATDTTLRRDSTGSAVRKLQEDLHELDFYDGVISGKYGGLTQEAVRLFQKKHGLDADGIAGPKTLKKIASLMGESTESEIPTIGSILSPVLQNGTTTLRHGMQGDAVEKLQEDLDELDYYTGSVTGKFGNLTKEAVRLFQRDYDLTSDGIAGPKTLAKIKSVLSGVEESETDEEEKEESVNTGTTVTVKPSVSLDEVSKLNTEVTLRRGSRSGYVTRLQKALTALGYFTDKCDGSYGNNTEEAVKLYQKAKGLTDDGVAGRATLRAINKDVENGVTASTVLID